jgi:hypothetical protein
MAIPNGSARLAKKSDRVGLQPIGSFRRCDEVTFRYKDYRHDAQQKMMILQAEEFIRRFLLHGCTCCPTASSASAITASWATDAGNRN